MVELSVIIPCYNEADNILHVVNNIIDHFKGGIEIEVLFVNNGSTDKSSEIFEKISQYDSRNIFFRVVSLEKNGGYGGGILAGLKAARGNVLSWTHADLQADASDICQAYKRYGQFPYEVFIKGKRLGRRFYSRILTWGMEIIVFVVLGIRVREINAQPKLFSRRFFKEFLEHQAPVDTTLDLYACYCAAKKGELEDISVVFKRRRFGVAHGGEGDIIKILKTIIQTIKGTFRVRSQFIRKL